MLIRKSPDLRYSDITPKSLYMNRRDFLAAMGIGAAGVAAAGSLGAVPAIASPTGSVPVKLNGVVKSSYTVPDKITPMDDVTHYNNYYEFGTDKGDPAKNSGNFSTANWSVAISGEVNKPRTFTMDEIMKLAPLEERVYRMRCVEAWSVVIPWIGYSFSTLAKLVEPTQSARYVAFQTYYDSKQMPLGRYAGIDLPYVEGLRIDEAMHPLTLLSVGMYDETLPNQDGGPVRMVIPWKYGFKGIKSIVKIRFVKDQPPTTWNIANAHEYGFYSNVNPHVDHPRWSQATERRLGDLFRRPTLMYNGYDQVASLYNGMDLRKYY